MFERQTKSNDGLRCFMLTEISLIPHASIPSCRLGVRVTGSSVGVAKPISVITPVHTTPDVAVAWHPYSLSRHMNEKTLSVTLRRKLTQGHSSPTSESSHRLGYPPGTARHGAHGLPLIVRPGRRARARVACGTTAIGDIRDPRRGRGRPTVTGRPDTRAYGCGRPVHVAEVAGAQQHAVVVGRGEA